MQRARLYVSISPDLGHEREVMGRAVAGLPVDVGWEVSYTPGPTDPNPVDPLTAARADVYVLALGADIRAPMGVEWTAARRAALTPLALLKEVPHTPAAQEFVKTGDIAWVNFKLGSELTPKLQLRLCQAILDRAARFQLSTPEWSTLQEFVKGLQEKQTSPAEDTRQGAGQGGVIFAPSREAGQGGVLIPKTKD